MDTRLLHSRYLLDVASGKKNIAGVGLCTLVSAGFFYFRLKVIVHEDTAD